MAILVPPPEPDAAPVAADKLGQPIEGHIAEAFARSAELTAMMSALSKIKARIKKGRKEEDPLFADINFNSLDALLSNARTGIKKAVPYAKCPYCTDGCRACLGRGWVGEFMYRHAPEDTKK